jgi:hypothetical protein
MFVPPETYLQIKPLTSELEYSGSGLKRRLASTSQDDADEEKDISGPKRRKSGPSKKKRIDAEESSVRQKKKRTEEMVEETSSSVSVAKKTKKSHQEKSPKKKNKEPNSQPEKAYDARIVESVEGEPNSAKKGQSLSTVEIAKPLSAAENVESSLVEEKANSSSGPTFNKTPTKTKKSVAGKVTLDPFFLFWSYSRCNYFFLIRKVF